MKSGAIARLIGRIGVVCIALVGLSLVGVQYSSVIGRNVEWLRPWEATPPNGPSTFGVSTAVFTTMTRRLRADAHLFRAQEIFYQALGGRASWPDSIWDR